MSIFTENLNEGLPFDTDGFNSDDASISNIQTNVRIINECSMADVLMEFEYGTTTVFESDLRAKLHIPFHAKISLERELSDMLFEGHVTPSIVHSIKGLFNFPEDCHYELTTYYVHIVQHLAHNYVDPSKTMGGVIQCTKKQASKAYDSTTRISLMNNAIATEEGC